MGGVGGDVPAKWKVKFSSNFLPAWIEEEMGEHGGLWSEPGKGRFSGGHARAGMMMKRRREKFDRGFRFGLVSVLPGEETSGVGAGGDMPAERSGK